MSNELDIFSQGTAVTNQSNWDDGMTSRVTAASVTSKRITFTKNKFIIKVNGNEVNRSNNTSLDVVVVNASDISRMYYNKPYNVNDKDKPHPVCWTSNSQAPDASVPEATDEKPGRQADKCATCPQNVKGTGANNTKACRFERRLAVVLASQDDTGNWFYDKELYQMKLASMSIFPTDGPQNRRAFNAYSDYLKANNSQLMGVVSRITFDESTQVDKVGFQAVGRLTEAQFTDLKTLQATEESKRAITITVGGSREEHDEGDVFSTKAPAIQAPVQQAVTQPAPTVVPEPVVTHQAEVIPEPKVVSTSKPVPQAPVKVDLGDISLDDLVGDWA